MLGWERAAGQREAFLCEGVFDYLTAVSWRLPACSPCGTQLPADRLGFLARAVAVYGVFDGDAAGREATWRFGELLGARWRPIALPDGLDLNDLGRRPDGRALFFRLLAEARRRAERKQFAAAQPAVLRQRKPSDMPPAVRSGLALPEPAEQATASAPAVHTASTPDRTAEAPRSPATPEKDGSHANHD
ncbi:MAG: toprim domain-containing protein [Chloroflexota bacterium]